MIEPIYQITRGLVIVRTINSPSICWVSGAIIKEDDLAFGLYCRNNDLFRIVHPDSIPTFKKLLRNPEETPYIQRLQNKVGLVSESPCICCGDEIQEDDTVIVITDTFEGRLDPVIHEDCTENFLSLFGNLADKYSEELVAHAI